MLESMVEKLIRMVESRKDGSIEIKINPQRPLSMEVEEYLISWGSFVPKEPSLEKCIEENRLVHIAVTYVENERIKPLNIYGFDLEAVAGGMIEELTELYLTEVVRSDYSDYDGN